ncbi:MAG: ATP-binding protein, partial [Candidatus Methanomethylophilaceae archaeon]
MRIISVNIASYGKIRDRKIPISPGLTVVHGPNESGKTTVMEFIRNTLVPTNKRDVYPERAKTDSGSITYEEDGTEGTIILMQRARGGDVPDSISRLEPDLFRSVFAMGQRELDDDRLVTSGEMASRFLSVPGGDGMPSAMDYISERVDSKVGKTGRSPSELNSLDGRISAVDSDIARLRSSAESYGTLAERRDSLKRDLEEAGRDAEASRRDSEVAALYESQRENYRRLSSARNELNALGDFRRVSRSDSDRAVALEADVRNARSNLDADRAEVDRLKGAMRGADPDVVAGIRGRMDDIIDGRGRYRSESSKPAEEQVRTGGGGSKALLVAGLALIVLGVVASVVTPFALVLSAVGAVVAAFGLRRRPSSNPSVQSRDETFISSYEGSVRDVSDRLGFGYVGIEQAMDTIASVAEAYDRLRDHAVVSSRIRDEYLSRRSELDSFYSGFSGREGFSRCSEKTAREAEL